MSEPISKLAERARKAEKIIADPSNYKVCEGCDSIVAMRVTVCPNCDAYRFDESGERVIQQAQLLGSREQTSVSAEDME